MANKTKRKFLVRSIRPNKKTMKGGVACAGPALFKWQANSCYLDSLLIGWLHFADADFLDTLMHLREKADDDYAAKMNGEGEKEAANKASLIGKLIEIYESLKLYGPVPAQDVTKLREEFRTILQKCTDFTSKMPEPNLKNTQDPVEIFAQLTDFLNINDI